MGSFKKEIKITNAFQKIFEESNHKANKIWIDKGSQFFNRSMKSFLGNNDIDMYSMHVLLLLKYLLEPLRIKFVDT